MLNIRRPIAALAAVLAVFGSIGVVIVATELPSAALSCTDNWVGPSSGTTSWTASSSNWSAGTPTGTSVVCISEPGTYTVDLTNGTTIAGLQVGGGATGTQTLEVDGSSGNSNLSLSGASEVASAGVLSLDPSSSGYADVSGAGGLTVDAGGALTSTGASNTAYIETALTNQGTVTLGAATNRQDEGTLTTNEGSFTVSSGDSFDQSGGNFTDASGTLTVDGTFDGTNTFTQSGGVEAGTNPVTLLGATLADSAGTGSFTMLNGGTITGTVPTGQTVTVNGSSGNSAVTIGTSTAGVTDDGTVALDPSASGYANIKATSTWPGLTVASGGAVSSTGSSNTAYIETPLVNQSGGTVTLGATNNSQDQGTLTTNDGSFTVSSGTTFNQSGGDFTDASGTLTVTGTFDAVNTFTQSGGTESGNPVTLRGATLADSAGTGSFSMVNGGNVTGTIPTGQTVTVNGSSGNSNVTMGTSSTGVTDDGVLALDPSSSGYADVSATSTWPGLTVASGGRLSSTGSSNTAYIETPLVNQSGGTVTLGATNNSQDQGTLTTNDGSFTVSSGTTFNQSGGDFTDASGTLTVTGTFDAVNTFTQSGGTESGNPVTLRGATLADSAGTGSFTMVNGGNITGTIPSGQTVTVNGSSGNSNVVVGSMSAGVTDDGSLVEAPSSSGYADLTANNTWPGLTIGSGGALTTTGATNTAYIETAIAVNSGGTVTISAPDSRYDQNTLWTNSGTVQVTASGHLAISGSTQVSNSSSGTIGVTVGSSQSPSLGNIVDTSGTPLGLGLGTLAVTTNGSEAGGTPITGSTGTFGSFNFGPDYYTVTYPGGSSVQLAAATPFASSATSFSPKENESITPQVASFTTNGEPGTYSATVNYGDGSGVQTATVNMSGGSGTVTGPAHTYTTPGPYTVTVVISTTAGTTETVSESVSATGPTITSLSKTTVKPKKSLKTKVMGTSFDGTGTFSTSDPTNLSVTSATYKPATKKKAAYYLVKLKAATTAPAEHVSLTLTQTGADAGKYTDVGAITIS